MQINFLLLDGKNKKDYNTAHKITNDRYDYGKALKKWKKETGNSGMDLS